jgi:hypothetical protein
VDNICDYTNHPAPPAPPVYHDCVWITYVNPGESYNYQMTMKISNTTFIAELFDDVATYWGVSGREHVLLKGEEQVF